MAMMMIIMFRVLCVCVSTLFDRRLPYFVKYGRYFYDSDVNLQDVGSMAAK